MCVWGKDFYVSEEHTSSFLRVEVLRTNERWLYRT